MTHIGPSGTLSAFRVQGVSVLPGGLTADAEGAVWAGWDKILPGPMYDYGLVRMPVATAMISFDDPGLAHVGTPLDLSGWLGTGLLGRPSGEPVSVFVTPPGGSESLVAATSTGTGGTFSVTNDFPSSGRYQVRVHWDGDATWPPVDGHLALHVRRPPDDGPWRKTSADEYGPVASPEYVAWTHVMNGRAKIMAVATGGIPFEVSVGGGDAYTGGLNGSLLAYQRVRRGRSNIGLIDLATMDKKPVGPGVNTPSWEYLPGVTEDKLMFGRFSTRTGTSRLILYDRQTGEQDVLSTAGYYDGRIYPGQMLGDRLTFSACSFSQQGTSCQVEIYQYGSPIAWFTPTTSPRQVHYAPALAADDVTYYVEGSRRCGKNVDIMRFTQAEEEGEVWIPVPAGNDIGGMNAVTAADGSVDLYFDHLRCATGAWDIYDALDDDRSPMPDPAGPAGPAIAGPEREPRPGGPALPIPTSARATLS